MHCKPKLSLINRLSDKYIFFLFPLWSKRKYRSNGDAPLIYSRCCVIRGLIKGYLSLICSTAYLAINSSCSPKGTFALAVIAAALPVRFSCAANPVPAA